MALVLGIALLLSLSPKILSLQKSPGGESMGTEVGGKDAGKLEKASEFDLVHGLDAQTCTAETSDKQ
eukprot:1352691-Amorphochlora_amoeboformis.AAC.1